MQKDIAAGEQTLDELIRQKIIDERDANEAMLEGSHFAEVKKLGLAQTLKVLQEVNPKRKRADENAENIDRIGQLESRPCGCGLQKENKYLKESASSRQKENETLQKEIETLRESIETLRHDLHEEKRITAKLLHREKVLGAIKFQDVRRESMASIFGEISLENIDNLQPTGTQGGSKTLWFGSMGGESVVVLVPTQFSTLAHYRKFTNEITHFARMERCRRVVPYFGTVWFRTRKIPGMVLKRLRGPLTDLLQAPPLPSAARLRVLLQMAEAIEEMHCRQVIHRDVKLANFLYDIGPDNNITVFITDFDTSQAFEGGILSTACGTLEYAAPEQDGLHTYDYSADVYAWAASALELVCHACGFVNISESARKVRENGYQRQEMERFFKEKRQQMLQIGNGDARNMVNNETLNAVLGDCLSPVPAARPTISQVVQVLRSLE